MENVLSDLECSENDLNSLKKTVNSLNRLLTVMNCNIRIKLQFLIGRTVQWV